MNELDKKFEKKRSQILSDFFSPDGAAFVGSFRVSLGRDWVGVVSKCTMGLFWGCHPFLLENGSKRGPIKQFEATPTQSLVTSGRFARKSIRPDLSHFIRWNTTLYNMVNILIRDAVFNLNVKLGFHKRSHYLFYVYSFSRLKRTTKTHRANRRPSGETTWYQNDHLTSHDELNTAPISSLSLTAANLHLWNPANTSLITKTRQAARSRKLTAWVSASLAMPIPCINRRSRFSVAMVTG